MNVMKERVEEGGRGQGVLLKDALRSTLWFGSRPFGLWSSTLTTLQLLYMFLPAHLICFIPVFEEQTQSQPTSSQPD